MQKGMPCYIRKNLEQGKMRKKASFFFVKNESICLKRRSRIDMVIRKTELGMILTVKYSRGKK